MVRYVVEMDIFMLESVADVDMVELIMSDYAPSSDHKEIVSGAPDQVDPRRVNARSAPVRYAVPGSRSTARMMS